MTPKWELLLPVFELALLGSERESSIVQKCSHQNGTLNIGQSAFRWVPKSVSGILLVSGADLHLLFSTRPSDQPSKGAVRIGGMKLKFDVVTYVLFGNTSEVYQKYCAAAKQKKSVKSDHLILSFATIPVVIMP